VKTKLRILVRVVGQANLKASNLNAFLIFLLFAEGKVSFACYHPNFICIAWEQYRLAQVLNDNLISE